MSETLQFIPAIAMRDAAANSHRDPAQTVVSGVNWHVNPGELWVLAGPQRSGKSDFLMMTCGLTAPTAGTYHFLGEPMPIYEDERLAHRRKLGFVFDSGQLFNRLTVAENVALPIQYHFDLDRAEAEARLRTMLDRLELAERAQNYPANLARNWQKRAGLARALMLQPEVLLVDNPLGGLDSRHAAWWLNFLEQLCAGHSLHDGQPMTVIVTTDDLPRMVSGLGKRCRFAVLSAGKLRVIGDRAELLASRDPEVRELLAGEEANRAD